jgi:probable HAF family extracellular repeat protein
MNSAGQVIGQSGTASGEQHAFFWDDSHGIMDISAGHQGTSNPFAINSAGTVTGTLNRRAFVWSRTSGLQELADPEATSYPIAINSSGMVFGYSYIFGISGGNFLFGPPGYMEDLQPVGMWVNAINSAGQLAGGVTGCDGQAPEVYCCAAIYNINTGEKIYVKATDFTAIWSSATLINSSGQVAGFWTGDGIWSGYAVSQQAFIWDSTHGMYDLGNVEPTAINSAGQVIGYFLDFYGLREYCFFWERTGTEVLSLGGRRSEPGSINSNGQVIGQSETASGAYHGFVWDRANGIRDLNLGGSSSHAYDINSSGRVVGSSYTASGQQHAFLWTLRSAGHRISTI